MMKELIRNYYNECILSDSVITVVQIFFSQMIVKNWMLVDIYETPFFDKYNKHFVYPRPPVMISNNLNNL